MHTQLKTHENCYGYRPDLTTTALDPSCHFDVQACCVCICQGGIRQSPIFCHSVGVSVFGGVRHGGIPTYVPPAQPITIPGLAPHVASLDVDVDARAVAQCRCASLALHFGCLPCERRAMRFYSKEKVATINIWKASATIPACTEVRLARCGNALVLQRGVYMRGVRYGR